MTRSRYQQGSLRRVRRSTGYEVWMFRWRETAPDGKPRPRKVVIGPTRELRTEAAARQALEALRLNINLDLSENARRPRTLTELIGHYKLKELAPDNSDKAFSTKKVYQDNIRLYILPRWGDYTLTRLENGIAIHVEAWLKQLSLARATKAKIRNIMSAICSHAIRYGWMKHNPIHAVRQSAKRDRTPEPLDVQELKALFTLLNLRERTLVMLAVPTGMRVGELLALQWKDIGFEKQTLNIHKSIWHQQVGPVKTEGSERLMPLDQHLVADLLHWRSQTPYAGDEDWIFASERMKGKQPLWPENLIRNHIRPAAESAGITKRMTWHVFRHTFSSLLAENNEDVKTVQTLMRHANSRITLDVYTHGVDGKKRRAQSKVVDMITSNDT
jgi:integrase